MRIQDMTLRQLLNKNLEVEFITLNYDGCIIRFHSMGELEDEAFRADFIDEEIKNIKQGRKQITINM
jgi:hypothetical protein